MMDIAIKSRPFTNNKLKKIKKELNSGRIRRFGAIVDHRKLKFSYNALIAWKGHSISQTATRELKGKDYVSHAYLRKASRPWPYGLYTMIHAHTQGELDLCIKDLSSLLKKSDFRVLNTVKELKKTSFKADFS